MKQFKRVLEEAKEALNKGDKAAICTTIGLLHEKFRHAYNKKDQSTRVSTTEESEQFDKIAQQIHQGTLNGSSTLPLKPDHRTSVTNYLNLFLFKNPIPDTKEPAASPLVFK